MGTEREEGPGSVRSGGHHALLGPRSGYGVTSVQVENWVGLVQALRLRGAGREQVGAVPIQEPAPPEPGAPQTRLSSPGTSFLTSLRTQQLSDRSNKFSFCLSQLN